MVSILWFNFNACNLVKFTAKAELASLSLNASISQVVDQFVLLHPVQPDKVLLAPMYQGKRYLLQLFCDFKIFLTDFWLRLSVYFGGDFVGHPSVWFARSLLVTLLLL